MKQFFFPLRYQLYIKVGVYDFRIANHPIPCSLIFLIYIQCNVGLHDRFSTSNHAYGKTVYK